MTPQAAGTAMRVDTMKAAGTAMRGDKIKAASLAMKCDTVNAAGTSPPRPDVFLLEVVRGVRRLALPREEESGGISREGRTITPPGMVRKNTATERGRNNCSTGAVLPLMNLWM